MAATIKDVAHLASVSIATVSRVLNNPKKVDPLTREQVYEAMRILDYHINPLAQSLRTRQTYDVAVIVHSLAHPPVNRFLEQLESQLAARGYRMILSMTHGDDLRRDQLSKLLLSADRIVWLAEDEGLSFEFPVILHQDEGNLLEQVTVNLLNGEPRIILRVRL